MLFKAYQKQMHMLTFIKLDYQSNLNNKLIQFTLKDNKREYEFILLCIFFYKNIFKSCQFKKKPYNSMHKKVVYQLCYRISFSKMITSNITIISVICY